MTEDDAKKLLEEERKKRADACQKEIADVLQKYNCELQASLIIQGGQIQQPLMVVAKK